MNPFLGFIAKFIAKVLTGGGILPANDWKSVAGLILALAGVVANYLQVDVPNVNNDIVTFIGSLLAAFGLGDKSSRA